MVEMEKTPQDVVARGYDRVAEEYAALEGEREWPRMRWLRETLGSLPTRSRVLDIGCGSGVPATQEIAREHEAVGVDVSARQIALARKNVPAARFERADILSLRYLEESFDAIVALYVLDHIPRDEHADLLRRIRSWLRPGGLLLFTVETEDQPGATDEWLGVQMYFSSFDEATARRMVQAVGFDILKHAIETQREGERDVPFLWVLATKPGGEPCRA